MFDCVPQDLAFTPFPQGAAYAAAARACWVTVRQVELDCGVAQVLERAGRRLVSRGPVWDAGASPRERRRGLRSLARFAGVTLATPEDDLRGFGLIPLVTPMHHAIWDLSGDGAGDLRAGMAGKWRNRLAAAERAGLRVQPASARVLPRLVAQEGDQRARRRYRAHPAAFTLALPTPCLRLFDWRHAGDIGAGMVFVVDGATATYHLGWAGDPAKACGIHTLMLYRAALALREEGVRWLDLGSVNAEESPGLARFKLGTGAALKRLGSTLLVRPG